MSSGVADIPTTSVTPVAAPGSGSAACAYTRRHRGGRQPRRLAVGPGLRHPGRPLAAAALAGAGAARRRACRSRPRHRRRGRAARRRTGPRGSIGYPDVGRHGQWISGWPRTKGGSINPTVLEGTAPWPRTVVFKFPSRDAAMAWCNSASYQQEALPLRISATKGFTLLVDGLDSEASWCEPRPGRYWAVARGCRVSLVACRPTRRCTGPESCARSRYASGPVSLVVRPHKCQRRSKI
jgi:hypothetical protein